MKTGVHETPAPLLRGTCPFATRHLPFALVKGVKNGLFVLLLFHKSRSESIVKCISTVKV